MKLNALTVASLFCCGLGFGRDARAESQAKRPNVVLILADDMGFSDIGCYGSEIKTPNLDRLASNGLRFTQFYNAARCCPTRASLLTGLYPHQAGMPHMVDASAKYGGDLNDKCVTIAEALRPNGYRTAMVGKWHVTPANGKTHNWPRKRGFDRYYGTIQGAGSYYDPASLVSDDTPIKADRPGYFYTDALAEHAVGFVKDFAETDAPFFLYAAFTASHWPLHARPEEIAATESRYAIGWDALRIDRHKRMIDLGIVDAKWPLAPRDAEAPSWSDAKDKAWQVRRMAVYAAQIECMDAAIGRIVDAVKASGKLDDTLILFLADNGGCAEELRENPGNNPSIPKRTRDGRPVRSGNDPSIMPGPDDTYQSYGLPWAGASNTPFRRYKHWTHEGGIASPLIAHWPSGIAGRGKMTHQPGHLIDVMATCLDLSGTAYPTTRNGRAILPFEGETLRPILEGGERPEHHALFWEHEGNRAVRQGKRKLVSRYPGPWELYDLDADRTELHDLAKSEPGRAAELAALYDAWAKRANVRPWAEINRERAAEKAAKKARID